MDDLLVRPYRPSDLMHFQRIHAASGVDYRYPDLDSPLFIAKMVIERNGEPTTLLAGRVECESYLLTSGAPRERWHDIQTVQPEYLAALWLQGIDSTYCVVPPEINRHFGKRMASLGWEPTREWFPWTRSTVV